MSENVDPPSPHDKSEAPTKRGRGRPKGSKNKSAAAGAVEQEDPAPVIPRKRRLPRKAKEHQDTGVESGEHASKRKRARPSEPRPPANNNQPPKKRGRPPKAAAVET
ncbi:hypothetical protein R3P38DRAFT_1047569 [Favolaschia claudopus]|uniref:Uncharacterized protein n=1 Tax=Favolaschia claudopus TaxID=2862362 RepID=A0AAV9ZR17_9AGAR